MLLALDIGNSFTKGAIYKEGEVVSSFFFPTDKKGKLSPLVASLRSGLGDFYQDIDEAVASSVVAPLDKTYVQAVRIVSGIELKIYGQGTKGVIPDMVDDTSEVGADILFLCRGAYIKYGGNLFLADLGTADKLIYVSEGPSLCGLSIDAGLSLSKTALFGHASALSEEKLSIPSSPLGRNTKDCISSGLLYGEAYKILGFKKAFEDVAGMPLKGILCGGNGRFVKDLLPDFEYDLGLIHSGLEDFTRRGAWNQD